jgi:hypothetical protein
VWVEAAAGARDDRWCNVTRSLPLLTSSRAAAHRACARLHHLRYDEGYRPVRAADSLRLGTAVHLGLEAWWRAVQRGWFEDPHAEQPDPLTEALAAIAGVEDPFERVFVEVLLTGYHHRWTEQRLEPLAIEKPFEAPLRNPATAAASRSWRLAGKLDGIVLDASGRVFVLEHKTTSEDLAPGSDYWARLRLDAQASTYLVGARALGFEPAGLLYDVIRKPALRPLLATPEESRRYGAKTGELDKRQRNCDEAPEEYRERLISAIADNPERYYARAEVVRLEDEEQDAAYDLWETARAISEGQRAGRAPRNPDACKRWGRTCEFFGVCTRAESLDSGRFRRIDPSNPNEELSP